MLKVAQIILKADQDHRLYECRELVGCEVAIQVACVAARFTPGLGHPRTGNARERDTLGPEVGVSACSPSHRGPGRGRNSERRLTGCRLKQAPKSRRP